MQISKFVKVGVLLNAFTFFHMQLVELKVTDSRFSSPVYLIIKKLKIIETDENNSQILLGNSKTTIFRKCVRHLKSAYLASQRSSSILIKTDYIQDDTYYIMSDFLEIKADGIKLKIFTVKTNQKFTARNPDLIIVKGSDLTYKQAIYFDNGYLNSSKQTYRFLGKSNGLSFSDTRTNFLKSSYSLSTGKRDRNAPSIQLAFF